MQTFSVHPVGVVSGGGEGPAQLRIDPAYRDGLRGLEGFGHAVAIGFGRHIVGDLFDGGGGVLHGHAQTGPFDHGGVV